MIVDFFLRMKMIVGVEGQKELALIWRNTKLYPVINIKYAYP